MTILLIVLVFVFGSYLSPIEKKFQFWWSTNDIEWIVLIILFLVSIVFSSIISFQRFKNFKYKSKFLRVFLGLNFLVLMFLSYISIESYFKEKNALTIRENKLIIEAKNDIKNDNVAYKFAGGFEISVFNQQTENKIDSIYKKYGIKHINTGCIIDLLEIQAQEKYSETVEPYLEKRNGKNWKANMEAEIEKIQKEDSAFYSEK